MTSDSFATRVQTLRDSWVERRQVKALASSHDFDSQFQLLATLHGWAVHAVHDIRSVYGETLPVAVSEAPRPADTAPGFAVIVDDRHRVTFALAERKRLGTSRWFIAVALTSGPGGGVMAAGPERRNGQWTRGRLEDLLLSALGAYERALSDAEALPFGHEYSTPAG